MTKELKIKALIEKLLYSANTRQDYLEILAETKEILDDYPRAITEEYNTLININSKDISEE